MNAPILHQTGAGLSGKRVLVLEDRLVSQTVIQEQLKMLGVDCTLAANGLKAFEMFESGQFDLILCDCSMPEMSGYDFTRTLRRQESSGRRIPVIALTANNFQDDAAKCSEAGMDDFVSKPVTADQLAAVLGKWLNPLEPPPASADWLHANAAHGANAVDMEALAAILGTDDVDVLHRVLKESLATVGSSLSEVEAASTSGDPDRLIGAVRNAKGEARCMAASGLAELYARLERHALAGERSASRDLIVRIAQEARRIEDFIRGYLAATA